MTAANRTSPDRRWLHRFACFTAAATLLLICSGGMVTSKGVGLAVPDWPTTFGYNMFFFPFSKWVGGILFEHTHRLLASVVGFLTIILAVWLARADERRAVRMLGWAALGAVVLQGVLGGLRVTMLKDEIGIFHACLAQAFFGMLVLIALLTSVFWRRLSARAGGISRSSTAFALAITVLIYLQLALGATMRHQHRDLAITDFPFAYGQVLPTIDAATLPSINEARARLALSEVTPFQVWLQMAHRFVALMIGMSVLGFWLTNRRSASALRVISRLWLLALVTQITLGAWIIWSNKAADIATAHVAVGALSLGLGIVAVAVSWRLRHEPATIPLREMPPILSPAGAAR